MLERYFLFLVFVWVVYIIASVQLIKLEKICKSETDAMKEYRSQTMFYEEQQSVDLVNIISLQLTMKRNSILIISKTNEIMYTIKSDSKNKMDFEQNLIPIIKEDLFNDQEVAKSHQENNRNSDMNCILKIPSIGLEKPVFNKNTKAYLKNYYLVTAYDNMDFSDGGTYIVYGHNSYVDNLSFQSLPKIQLTDAIIVEYMNHNYEFLVKEIQKVKPEQISNYFLQEENKIVLVACTNQSTKRNPEYLVVVAERDLTT